MNLKYFILGGVAVLLGFLLYPRGEDSAVQEYARPLRQLDNEPLHYTGILRTTPIYTTFDLGYVYKIDKVEIHFDNPNESGPKQFDLLVQTDRMNTPFPRAFSYVGSSREYKYSTHSLPIPAEARWIQIVINDWFSDRPRLKNEEFRVGLRHESPSQFFAVEANQNDSSDLIKLVDLLASEDSKWKGARRIEEKVEIDGKTVRQISYASPDDAVEVTVDLGAVSTIHGFRVTTDGPGNNLKRFRILVSPDGEKYSEAYASDTLPDEIYTDLHLFESSRVNPSNSNDLPHGDAIRARYVRLQIDNGDWYGSYPELREFEVFTDAYRPPPLSDVKLSDYNAVQMHYENLGLDGNVMAPHLIQGFAFDRDSRDENHYFIAPEKVDAGNTPSQLSFAYHYDKVKLRYTGLDPSHLYWVRTTYLGEKGGGRIQNFVLDGFIMHDGRLVPEGKAELDVFGIPSDAYADGIIELDFNRLAGPNAVVSEVSILEARIATDTDLDAASRNQDIGWAIRVPSEPSSASRVVIDGQLNEWSQLYPLLPDGYDTSANTPIALHTQWDEDNLYIAAVTHQQQTPIENLGAQQDEGEDQASEDSQALHIFVDTALRRSPGMYTASDHHFTFTIFNSEGGQTRVVPAQIHHHLDAIPNSIEHHQAIETALTKTASGYTLEARIPRTLALSEYRPKLGGRIGLNYVIEGLNRLDNPSRRLAYGTSDLTAPPNRWNLVQLVNQISGQVAIIGQHRSAAVEEAIALTEVDGYNPRSHAMFSAGDILILCVWDTERNTNRVESESITAELRNETTGELRMVVLHESDPSALIDDDPENDWSDNSFLFAAKVETRYREPDHEIIDSDTALKPAYAPAPLLVDGKEVISLTYIDPLYTTTQQDEPVETSTAVKTGTTGTVAITNESGEIIREFELDDTIYIRVQDADLDAIDSASSYEINVRLLVPQTPEAEVVKLSYKQDQDAYVGEIITVYSESPAPGDGALQSVGKRSVEAQYLDEIQGSGRTNVSVSARADAVVGKTARIQFRPGADWNARNDHKFFYAGDQLAIWLTDTDLNLDNDRRETVDVTLRGSLLGDQFDLTLTEIKPELGAFVGFFQTRHAKSAVANGILEVTGTEIVTVSHLDLLQGSGETDVVVTDRVFVKAGGDGVIEILKSNFLTRRETFNAGETLYFRLHDEDITDETVDITLTGNGLNDRETVHLLPSPAPGDAQIQPVKSVFYGSIPTVYDLAATKADGVLQVEGTEQISAIYIDELRASGEVAFAVTANCVVNAGATGSLRVFDRENFTSDAAENPEISRFRAGDTLILEIQDSDLNKADAAADLFEMDFNDNTLRDDVRVSMVETRGGSGVFRGELRTGYGETPIPTDNILQVQGGGIVNFTYVDALQNTGATQVPITATIAVRAGDKGELRLYGAESGKLISDLSVGTGSFEAGERLRIELIDKDLNRSREVVDTVMTVASGNVLRDEVTLILEETGADSTIFVGELRTQNFDQTELSDATPQTEDEISSIDGEASAVASKDSTDKVRELQPVVSADNLLQVVNKERITVEYIDMLTTTGEPNVPIWLNAIVLGSSPGLLRIVNEDGVGPQFDPAQELAKFNAGEPIYFRLEDLLLSTVIDTQEVQIAVAGNKTQDRVSITLRKHPEAREVFTAFIPTRYGTSPIADDTLDVQGAEEVRAVYNPPPPIVQDFGIADYTYVNYGARGKLSIINQDGTSLANFNIGTSLYFRLEDADLNRDPFVTESVKILAVKTDPQSTTHPSDSVDVSLYEDGPNSHIFRGMLSTSFGRSSTDKVIGLVGEEIVTATYEDALIDTGEINVEIEAVCRGNPVAWAQYTAEPVVIDGIDDKWPLERVIRTSKDEGLIWLQWSDDSLYLLAQIYDDDVKVPNALRYYEGADALEIHINLQPTGDSTPRYLQTGRDPNRYILWICPKGAGFGGDQPYIGQWQPDRIYNYEAINLKAAVREQPNYYIIEARIPFYPVLGRFDPIKTKRHKRIGFNVVIHRSDDQRVYWAKQPPGAETASPSDLGMLILEEPDTR